ncbi:hypothetical protein GCM10011575_40360 [Microlunatus endophyticus]|uniref:M23ase beta-sheet core domain-containing protein n=1 Tax=Microlunatus endophyticus TaxID=1716077 RepID=A0A917SFH4_9ACTN|nr:M23 family metallopeptidase [Microlunatus endophyticus]GGL78005.1 hypothetical protein GCM10011575_40360 [Microlunatus endophyticus]
MSPQPRRKSDAPLNRFNSLRTSASGVYRHSSARRAIEEIEKDRRGWLRNGIAALAISGLGLGVAGAVAATSSAHDSHGAATSVTVANSSNSADSASGAVTGRTGGSSRSAQRPALNSGAESDSTGSKSVGQPLDGTVDMSARQDAQANAKVTDTSQQDAAAEAAAAARAKALKSTANETQKLSSKLSKAGVGGTDTSGDGTAHLPVNPGQFTIAATFGEVGSWARYHTGVDFAAPIGTPIHATANGVVTNAGIGPASSWAGNYVVIKFADGEQMLFAHMESTAVTNGQKVTGGQVIGHVGMTGRAFGPHTHVELYPVGVTPGDVYSAVNPVPWFTAHGLKV